MDCNLCDLEDASRHLLPWWLGMLLGKKREEIRCTENTEEPWASLSRWHLNFLDEPPNAYPHLSSCKFPLGLELVWASFPWLTNKIALKLEVGRRWWTQVCFLRLTVLGEKGPRKGLLPAGQVGAPGEASAPAPCFCPLKGTAIVSRWLSLVGVLNFCLNKE